MNETKICSKCGKNLPKTLEYFNGDKKRKDGFYPYCKVCKGSRYRKLARVGFIICIGCQKELPATLEYFHKSNPTNRYGLHTVCRICRPQLEKRDNEYYKEYYKKNSEWLNANKRVYLKKHFQENRQYYYNKEHKRRAKERGLENTLTVEQWEATKDYFNNECCYCGKKEKLTQDHFIPIINNGGYTKENITPACPWCNASKGGRDFMEWFKRQDFYLEMREYKILNYLSA